MVAACPIHVCLSQQTTGLPGGQGIGLCILPNIHAQL